MVLCYFEYTQHMSEHDTLVLITLSSNEGFGEPAHLCRLTTASVACIHKVQMKIQTKNLDP